MMSTPKLIELQLSTPKTFDGTHSKATAWLNSICMYLVVNADVYNSNPKQIAFALSVMKEGTTATWAATF
jgi:hypothetical protein